MPHGQLAAGNSFMIYGVKLDGTLGLSDESLFDLLQLFFAGSSRTYKPSI